MTLMSMLYSTARVLPLSTVRCASFRCPHAAVVSVAHVRGLGTLVHADKYDLVAARAVASRHAVLLAERAERVVYHLMSSFSSHRACIARCSTRRSGVDQSALLLRDTEPRQGLDAVRREGSDDR